MGNVWISSLLLSKHYVLTYISYFVSTALHGNYHISYFSSTLKSKKEVFIPLKKVCSSVFQKSEFSRFKSQNFFPLKNRICEFQDATLKAIFFRRYNAVMRSNGYMLFVSRSFLKRRQQCWVASGRPTA